MDYGVWVKKNYPNPSRRSRHHTVQTPFAGSHRQSRAAVLRLLLSVAPAAMTAADIRELFPMAGAGAADIGAVLEELTAEGFLAREGERYGVV
jgi:A/G-specific adenine glycosylase